MTTPIILWFRHDLRLADNPALTAAVATGRPLIPLYINEPAPQRPRGGASNWWRHHSLTSLAQGLQQRGAELVVRTGKASDVIEGLMAETGANTIFWSRSYAPERLVADKALKARFKAESFNASLLFEPWTIQNKSGSFFQVFTPFWKHCLAQEPPAQPLPAPNKLNGVKGLPSLPLESFGWLPTKPNWAANFSAHWQPGEAGAHQRLTEFLRTGAAHYKEGRDRPDADHTSRLSPWLHWGEISPRQIWHATAAAVTAGKLSEENATKFISELGWREFSHHLLYHVPTLPHAPLNQRFSQFPWASDEKALKAWQRGLTGYPIVDAGMRQLWQTGWMHNRVRMITASFLVKDLLIPWQEGEAWFWDTLLDADAANNAASWQWVAGCGADAAPYFRIFNPVLQGERFDPDGAYVRTFVPELANVPSKYIHRPWEAPIPPKNYPAPIIDHHAARDRALAAFAEIKQIA